MTPDWMCHLTPSGSERCEYYAICTPMPQKPESLSAHNSLFFQFAIELSILAVELMILCIACTFHLPSLLKHTLFPHFVFFLFKRMFSALTHKSQRHFFTNPKKNQEARVSIWFVVGSQKHRLSSRLQPEAGKLSMWITIADHKLPTVPGNM